MTQRVTQEYRQVDTVSAAVPANISEQVREMNKSKSNPVQASAGGVKRPVSKLPSTSVAAPLDDESMVGPGDMGRSFSSRLRELRREKGLSLRKLGREIGVTANAVLRWEKDEVTPTRGKMLELSRFFDIEPAWLAWGIGSRRARLKPEDLLTQLGQCDESQLAAVSALLDAFQGEH